MTSSLGRKCKHVAARAIRHDVVIVLLGNTLCRVRSCFQIGSFKFKEKLQYAISMQIECSRYFQEFFDFRSYM